MPILPRMATTKGFMPSCLVDVQSMRVCGQWLVAILRSLGLRVGARGQCALRSRVLHVLSVPRVRQSLPLVLSPSFRSDDPDFLCAAGRFGAGILDGVVAGFFVLVHLPAGSALANCTGCALVSGSIRGLFQRESCFRGVGFCERGICLRLSLRCCRWHCPWHWHRNTRISPCRSDAAVPACAFCVQTGLGAA